MLSLVHAWNDTGALITDACTRTESLIQYPSLRQDDALSLPRWFSFPTQFESAWCGVPGVTRPGTSTDLGLFVEILQSPLLLGRVYKYIKDPVLNGSSG